MLFVHCIRRAASRAACTAGKSKATSTPIIAMTTSNSTSVKPAFRVRASEREDSITVPFFDSRWIDERALPGAVSGIVAGQKYRENLHI